MDKITKRTKKVRITFIATSFITCMIMVICFPWISGIHKNQSANNYYKAYFNGEVVGISNNQKNLQDAMYKARVMLNNENNGLVYLDTDFEIKAYSKICAKYDTEQDMVDKMYKAIKAQAKLDTDKAYVVNVNGFTVTLQSLDDVLTLLQTAKNKYDVLNEFNTDIKESDENGYKMFTCDLNKADVVAKETDTVMASDEQTNDITFQEDIEIVPSYVDSTQISPLDSALNMLTSGGANAELSVLVNSTKKYREDYSLETEYIYNDKMYNNQEKVLVEGSSGIKEIVANICTKNGEEVSRDIQSETIITPAVARVVEVGTEQPPTFVKPLSGGYISSYFGARWGTFHKGIDYACNTGTKVNASCDGKVVVAGWVNGYGNCIMIKHANGKSTRYGHLSKILVDVGDTVSQNQLIALSGNTGNSTGPHLHFEILVSGVQVNPLDFIN